MEKEQNFLTQVSAEKLQATPPGYYKSIFFDLLSVSAAFVFGYLYYSFLKNDAPLYWVLVSLVTFGVLLTLRVFLIQGSFRALLATLLEVGAILGPFYPYYKTGNLNFLMTAGVIIFVLLLVGNFSSKYELENAMRIRFFKTGKNLVGKFMTAIIIGMLVLYLPQWRTEDIFFSERSFQSIFSSIGEFAQKLYPEINFNSTVGDFVESWAKFELEKNKSFNTFPQVERQKAIQALSSQILSNFAGDKLEVSKNESLSNFFYRWILRNLTEWHTRYQNWFLVVWTVAVFLILKTLSFFFGWLILLVSFFAYQLLLNFGVINVIFESRPKETVEFT